MQKASILIIEDDDSTALLIRDTLERAGYAVRSSATLGEARKELNASVPDLIVLDRRMPDGDGLDFCREIRAREETADTPVLFLTASGGTSDRITGLRVGGDDYLPKPFDIDELAARVDSLLRRVKRLSAPPGEVLSSGEIVLDIARHECRAGGNAVELWPKEFELLRTFLENRGRLLSKDFLAERVWNRGYLDSSRTIEISVQRLRKKLGRQGERIETVKGYGFKLREG